jgi:hypothetical protein
MKEYGGVELYPRIFLGAFAKLHKATINFVMSVPSFRMEQLGSHWMDCRAFDIRVFFEDPSRKVKIH